MTGTLSTVYTHMGMRATAKGVRDTIFGNFDEGMVNMVLATQESSMSHMSGLGYDANSRSWAGRMTDRGYRSLIENTLGIEVLEDGSVVSQLNKAFTGEGDSGWSKGAKGVYNSVIGGVQTAQKPFAAMYAGAMPILSKKVKPSPKVALLMGFPPGKEVQLKDLMQGNGILPVEQMYRVMIVTGKPWVKASPSWIG